ncbi:MAG: twin-arginine translocation signal domain-containing protein [Planctomycetes bacterium]|nr:twin-arginine translocation signal domain-containing protein [Planctomycetota bacterium]
MTSPASRRTFLKNAALGAAAMGTGSLVPAGEPEEQKPPKPSGPIAIGSRRKLFVDDFLIERLDGARRVLHHPTPQEIALVHDAPWEGSGCGYHSVFQDGSLYRMYYKAWHLDVSSGKLKTNAHPLYCCYAESDDGIHWRKPKLGIHEFRGSKDNNIVMVSGKIGKVDADPGHPAVFKDDNPNCPPDARYKAIIRSRGPRGLLAFKSPDGLHWSPMADHPVITEGAFDSQNLAFWDPVRKEYRAYWRIFTAGVTTEKVWKPAGVRAIRTATSKDFLNWGPHADLVYKDSPPEHLYTNQIKAYYRAPHIFIGFPTRYIERGWSDSMRALPELEHRKLRAQASLRYGTALTEGLLMASRDGVLFERWNEAFLRPGIQRPGTWHYGQQYIAWHVVETRSALPGAPNELSLYAGESYWTGNSSELRRYTLRIDGFVSVQAPMAGGELITKPITFAGKQLTLNFSTSAAGDIRVELQQPDGRPIPGFALDDCNVVFGDELERTVTWKSGSDLSRLAGQPVRLRFVLRDADLYSFRFVT